MKIINFIFSAIMSILIVIIIYILDKKGKFNKLSYWPKQILIGIIFGLVSILGTEFGIVSSTGAVINVRNAPVICAGLIFGAPSGIIAGLIGGIERWFSVLWGIGSYTQIACTASTILCGIFVAILRKKLFDNKRPAWYYGIAVASITEVFHMLLIFITNHNDIKTAFNVIEACALPMILSISITVAIAFIAVNIIDNPGHIKTKSSKNAKTLSQIFQKKLFLVISICLCVSIFFNIALQTRIAKEDTQNIMSIYIDDISYNISNNKQPINKAAHNQHIGQNGYFMIVDKELNIISAPSDYEGKNIKDIGIYSVSDQEPEKIIYTKILNQNSFCMYKQLDDCFIIGIVPAYETFEFRDISVYISIFMQLIIGASIFLLIYFLIKEKIVANINTVNKDLAKITSGKLDVNVNANESIEFIDLSNDINKTVETLKSYIAREKSRIDDELKIARIIQSSSLPKSEKLNNYNDEFELFADMKPAKEVGGDFYDFYMIDEKRLAFLIADVSGKGISAAMFMMKAKALIKSFAKQGMDAAKVFYYTNQELCKDNEAQMFVTCWMGILDLDSYTLQYANAGHNPPLIKHKGNNYQFLKQRPNFVLGGLENTEYLLHTTSLCENDELFLYTDGVTEATNCDNKLYGNERLLNTLNLTNSLNTKDICNKVYNSVNDYVGNNTQSDDITMLSLKLVNQNVKSFIIDSDTVNIVTNFVEQNMKTRSVDKETISKINIAVDEICSNIIKHSSASDLLVKIEFNEGIKLLFCDNGKEYNFNSLPEPDTNLNIEERKLGGLGIHIVKNLMDSINYEYKNDKNIITIFKNTQ